MFDKPGSDTFNLRSKQYKTKKIRFAFPEGALKKNSSSCDKVSLKSQVTEFLLNKDFVTKIIWPSLFTTYVYLNRLHFVIKFTQSFERLGTCRSQTILSWINVFPVMHTRG